MKEEVCSRAVKVVVVSKSRPRAPNPNIIRSEVPAAPFRGGKRAFFCRRICQLTPELYPKRCRV